MVKRGVVVMLVSAFFLSSCFATKYMAPPSADVKLAPPGSACTVMTQKRMWYALWGLVPISDNNTASFTQGVRKVQFEDKFTVLDYVIAFFTGIVTIYPKTVIVYSCQ